MSEGGVEWRIGWRDLREEGIRRAEGERKVGRQGRRDRTIEREWDGREAKRASEKIILPSIEIPTSR